MLQPGQRLSVRIDKAVAGGRMLARHDGLVLLVSGGIPGETVDVRVERTGRGLAYARVERITEASPDRRPAGGDWTCGGTVYAFIAYGRQLELKAALVADALARIAHLPPRAPIPVAASPERGYRMRARLHARGGRLGFFREGSHEICDVRPTGMLLDETADVVDALSGALSRAAQEDVAWLEIAENASGAERVVHITMRAGAEARAGALASLGAMAGVTGLTAGREGAPRPRVISGCPTVSDSLAALLGDEPDAEGPRLTRHASSFFQANRYLLPRLVASVRAQVPAGPVVDLYAGVGLFACALAASGRAEVVAVEGDGSCAADLHDNLGPYGPRARAVLAPVERFLRSLATARESTFIVDPPRSGLSREARAAIVGLQPAAIVYVSCDVATLARDVRHFLDGGYAVQHLEAFDLFPNTPHVECVARLDRQ